MLQTTCGVPVSWGWDVVVIGAPWYVPRYYEDLITATMERMAWRSARKCDRGVVCEKGAVAKKACFFLNNYC